MAALVTPQEVEQKIKQSQPKCNEEVTKQIPAFIEHINERLKNAAENSVLITGTDTYKFLSPECRCEKYDNALIGKAAEAFVPHGWFVKQSILGYRFDTTKQ